MKKTLILAGITTFLLSSTMTIAAENDTSRQMPPQNGCHCKEMKRPERPNLDERLKLTEEQKQKAHELRMKGHEKIKPVMEKIKAKRQEIDSVRKSKLSAIAQQKQIAKLKEDMQKLKQEARKIREENMKEFEGILTAEQKAEFAKIKEEGKQKFEKMKKEGRHPGQRGQGFHPERPQPGHQD